jgi:hypothetical protein
VEKDVVGLDVNGVVVEARAAIIIVENISILRISSILSDDVYTVYMV